MIIDFHTHTFPSAISLKVAELLSHRAHTAYFIDPNAPALAASMRENAIDFAVNLPVMDRAGMSAKVNAGLIRDKDSLFKQGIITFGGLHPDDADFKEEIQKLKAAGIPGIKLHPAYQGTFFNDIRYKRLLAAIEEAGLITVVHGGLDVGLPEHNYVSVPAILEVLRDVNPERLVVAHMGGWQGWAEVEQDLAGAPVYLDTSYSLGETTPVKGEEDQMGYKENLTKEAFVRLTRKHGTEKVLFATDSPWAGQGEYAEWVKNSGLTESEQNKIFSENAMKLLNIGKGETGV